MRPPRGCPASGLCHVPSASMKRYAEFLMAGDRPSKSAIHICSDVYGESPFSPHDLDGHALHPKISSVGSASPQHTFSLLVDILTLLHGCSCEFSSDFPGKAERRIFLRVFDCLRRHHHIQLTDLLGQQLRHSCCLCPTGSRGGV